MIVRIKTKYGKDDNKPMEYLFYLGDISAFDMIPSSSFASILVNGHWVELPYNVAEPLMQQWIAHRYDNNGGRYVYDIEVEGVL